eukprot:403332878
MQLRFLQKYQEFDAVTSGYYLIDQNDQPIGFSPYHEGVDIEVLKLRGLWIHTMQYIATMIRVTDKIKPHLYFLFVQADDAVLTRHLMLNHDFNVYFTENRYLAFYRKFQRKQDQLTNQFVDLRNYQNDENYCGYDLLYKYENSSINRDDMSYIYQIQSDKETMATSIWKFLKSLFVKGEEEYEDLKWLSSYMIYGHVNNQLGYEVDPRKLMLQHYTFMFTDLISLQFDSTIPSQKDFHRELEIAYLDLGCALTSKFPEDCRIRKPKQLRERLIKLQDYGENLTIKDYEQYYNNFNMERADPCKNNYQVLSIKGHKKLVQGIFLEKAIWSVQNQTYQNWEFIIADDGSYDPVTLEVLEKYPKIDSRIKVIKLNSNYGLPPFARNVAVEHAKGQFLHIYDDDDVINPIKTELQVKFLLKYPHLDGTFSRFTGIDENDNFKYESMIYEGVDSQILRIRSIFYNTIQLVTSLIRLNERTRKDLYFAFAQSDDWLLARHLLLDAKFEFYFMEDQFLASWRHHSKKDQSITNVNRDRSATDQKNDPKHKQFLKQERQLTAQIRKNQTKMTYELDAHQLMYSNYPELFQKDFLITHDFIEMRCALHLNFVGCQFPRPNVIAARLKILKDKAKKMKIRDYTKYQINLEEVDPCKNDYNIPIIQGNQPQTKGSCPIIKQPLVSIITASFNKGYLLEKTIWSVQNQTYQNWELIIADDGSNDPITLNILDNYQKIDQRIKVIKLNSNYGLPPYARNVAIDHAKGQFLHVLDDDDVIDPIKTELQVKFLLKYTHLDGVYSRFTGIDENDVVQYESQKYGGVDSYILRLRTAFYNTMQLVTSLIRLNERTRKDLYFVFLQADDMLFSRHLLLDGNFQLYFMEDHILASWRRHSDRSKSVTSVNKDALALQNKNDPKYQQFIQNERRHNHEIRKNQRKLTYDFNSAIVLYKNYFHLFKADFQQETDSKDFACAIHYNFEKCRLARPQILLKRLQMLKEEAKNVKIRDYTKYQINLDEVDPCKNKYDIPYIKGHKDFVRFIEDRIENLYQLAEKPMQKQNQQETQNINFKTTKKEDL